MYSLVCVFVCSLTRLTSCCHSIACWCLHTEQEGNVPVLFTSAFKEHGDCNNTTAAATNGATVAREVVSAGHTADEPICID